MKRVIFYLIIIGILVFILIGWRDRVKRQKAASEVVCKSRVASEKVQGFVKSSHRTFKKRVCQVNKALE